MRAILKYIYILTFAGFTMMPLSAEAAAPAGTWGFTMHYFDIKQVGPVSRNTVNMSSDTSRGIVTVNAAGVVKGRIQGGLDINAAFQNRGRCVTRTGRPAKCGSKFATGTVFEQAVKTTNIRNRGPARGRFSVVGKRVTLRVPGLPPMFGYISLNGQTIVLEGNRSAMNQNVTMTLVKIK